jgi:N-acetylglucosaminyldiphosphoundecaprenol N-acetyl-beta-D-mannosaminyltransferase
MVELEELILRDGLVRMHSYRCAMESVAKQLKAVRPPCANILGVGISALNLDSAVQIVLQALERKARGYICVTGVHGVSEAQKDPSFRQILNEAFLNTPDGVPTVWMGRWQGFRDMGRVYGPDLMLRICGQSPSRGLKHFFYGGGPGVAEELRRRLEQRFPGLTIVGTFSPPFRPLTSGEKCELASLVAKLNPDVFWVGLSTPKQEKFMAQNWESLDATLFVGVGAAFDFHAGRVRQAPYWMQRSGLEWLFRLGCEPRRLWRRYLKNNPLFIARAICQITGLKKYAID